MEIKEILTKKQVTVGQIITFFIGLSVFIFMDTNLFKDLNDVIKVIIYIAIYGAFFIFGIEIFATKQLAKNIRNIITDKSLNPEQIVMKITQEVTEALIKLGEAWEIFDKEQFEKKEEII